MSVYCNLDNLEKWAKVILDDQYDDSYQNKDLKGRVTGDEILSHLISSETLNTPVVDIGSGSSDLGVDYRVEPNSGRMRKSERGDVLDGWIENIPLNDGEMESVICWGVLCFVRSPIESFMEVNRVLKMGGSFIFDMVLKSNLPFCQTVNRSSFLRHIELHGFEIRGLLEFGESHHRRLGIRCRKVWEWDSAWFAMPQCIGDIKNFLSVRDWYMR